MCTVYWASPITIGDLSIKYAHIARPLNVLISDDNAIKKKQAIKQNDNCEKSFKKLKHLCSSTPILAYTDYSKPFKLHADACNLGLGAILYQTNEDGLDRVIAYTTTTLSKSGGKLSSPTNWNF